MENAQWWPINSFSGVGMTSTEKRGLVALLFTNSVGYLCPLSDIRIEKKNSPRSGTVKNLLNASVGLPNQPSAKSNQRKTVELSKIQPKCSFGRNLGFFKKLD